MEHFAGLDVSVKETSVCIVDDTGRMVRVSGAIVVKVVDACWVGSPYLQSASLLIVPA